MKMQDTGEKMKKNIQSARLISHEQAATSERYGSMWPFWQKSVIHMLAGS